MKILGRAVGVKFFCKKLEEVEGLFLGVWCLKPNTESGKSIKKPDSPKYTKEWHFLEIRYRQT